MKAPAINRREKQRQATLSEIISVARELLRTGETISLRSVAQRMGITAPALYRYVDNVADLYKLVASDIDQETANLLAAARDTQPADDPAAQVTVVAFAFRRWALENRNEFGLMFTNPRLDHEHRDELVDEKIAKVFVDLVLQLWIRYRFPLPSLDDLEPVVIEALEDPFLPKAEGLPPEAKGLPWLCMRSWVALYGTVTLEVFRHCDPRLIDSGVLFRSMLAEQAVGLGFADEVPRLLSLIEAELTT